MTYFRYFCCAKNGQQQRERKRRAREGRKGIEKGEWVDGKGKRKSGREEGREVGEVGRDTARMKQELSISPAFCSRPTAFSFRITERFACSGLLRLI